MTKPALLRSLLPILVCGWVALFPQLAFSAPVCSDLLVRPKASQLLRQQGLPVSNTLLEVERMRDLIRTHPQLSGSILPLTERVFSSLQIQYKLNKTTGQVDALVRKAFHPRAASEFNGNWEAYLGLVKLEQQNLLGEFKVLKINRRSIKTMTFFMNYVEGVEIYPLVMEPNPKGAGFRPVQSVSQPVQDLLVRFDSHVRAVHNLWTQTHECSGQYEMEYYIDEINGVDVMTYFAVHAIKTGMRIFEISMFNTIYDPSLDRFVIFDPY